MDEEQFEEILLFFFMIFMDEHKNKKSKPLGFMIFLKKGTKKEHTTTLYKKCD